MLMDRQDRGFDLILLSTKKTNKQVYFPKFNTQIFQLMNKSHIEKLIRTPRNVTFAPFYVWVRLARRQRCTGLVPCLSARWNTRGGRSSLFSSLQPSLTAAHLAGLSVRTTATGRRASS